jgi:hypothetical protein
MSELFDFHVDQWAPEIHGWVLNKRIPLETVEIAVCVDGRKLAQVMADEPRPDVEAAGYSTAWCGFRVPMPELVKDTELHEVSLVDVSTGLEFSRPENRVCFNAASPILGESQRGKDSVLKVLGDRESFLTSVTANKRLALLSTFRMEGVIDGNVRHLVQSLIESGFEVLIIDTSQHCHGDSLGAGLLIHRKNFGLDFASWNAGLDFLGITTDSLDQMLLINDSCYGPFSKLSPIFEEIDHIEADVVSLTDGWFGGYHLQSNFLLLKNEALKNLALEVFFSNYGFPILKSSIVREGEIGFSKYLLVNGYRFRAVFSYEMITKSFVAHCQENLRSSDLSRDASHRHSLIYQEENWLHSIYDEVLLGEPLNLTHTFWAQLLAEGFPFVKKDLILSNPTRIPNLDRFQELVISNFGFRDFSNIKHDIQLRGKVPIHLD